MRCERCGRALPENSKFCLGCGHPVREGGHGDPHLQGSRTVAMTPPPWSAAEHGAGRGERRRGMFTAIAALLVLALILGGFALVLARRARQGGGVAQMARGTGATDFRLLPSPQGGANAPLVGQRPPGTASNAVPAPNSPGASVTTAPTAPPAGGSVAAVPSPNGPGGGSVIQSPAVAPGGPSVLGGPQGRVGGPSVLQGPGSGPGGPSVLQGPQGRVPGPSVVGGPQGAPSGPSVVSGPQGTPNGPSVVEGPKPERTPPRQEPPLEDISGYVDRLYRVEQMRLQLEARLMTLVTNTTLQSAMQAYMNAGSGGLDDNSTQAGVVLQTARDFELVARQFEQLTLVFGRRTPPVPNSCRRLHANYGLAVSNMPRIVRGLRDALHRMDIGAVQMIQGFGQSTVDRGFQIADQELERLCNERRASKPFDIGSGSRRSLLGP